MAFFEQHYSANLMKASLVATCRWQSCVSWPRSTLARYPTSRSTGRGQLLSSTSPLREPSACDTGRRTILAVAAGFIIDDNSHLYDTKPSEYLAYILASEMPDTPAVRLRELGWASSLVVSADPARYGNYGLFTFSVQLTPEGLGHQDALPRCCWYVDILREQGIDDRYAEEFGTSLANRFQFLEKMDEFTYAHELTRAMQTYPARYAISSLSVHWLR